MMSLSLSDCLACSGCITSSEEFLLKEFSLDSFINKFEKSSKKLIISISSQVITSLSTKYNYNKMECFLRLRKFFIQKMNALNVFDISLSRNISLIEILKEFQNKFEKNRNLLPLLTTSCPGFVCLVEKKHHEYVYL